jgi:hypothetical protein
MQPPAASTRQRSPIGRRLLIAAGMLSTLNGASHLVLPLVYPWHEHTSGLYEPVRWALYASTLFFGLLLLWGGLLVIVLARRDDVPPTVQRWVVGGLAVFWLAGGVYELVVPFPAPVADRLLPAFSLAVAGLLTVGLMSRNSQRSPQRASTGPETP